MTTNAAGALIFNADETQVLLCKREDFRIWSHPEGGPEDVESLEYAATREVFEETGYQIGLDRPIERYWHPQIPHGGNLMHLFEAHVTGGEPTTRFETIDLRSFPVNELPLRMLGWIRTHIADALAKNSHVVERAETLPLYISIVLRLCIALRDLRNKWILKHR